MCNLITGGISKGCDNNNGGLKAVYITDWDSVSATTVSTANTVTAITMDASTSFYEFTFTKNGANYEEATAINLEVGSTFYNQTLSLTIPRREVTKRNTLATLVAGQKLLAVIVKDNNDVLWFLGYTNGMQVSEITGGSGAKKEDGSNYSVKLVGEEPQQAYTVSSAALTAVI